MTDEQNGTRQTVGEVRGELSALTREVEHMRVDLTRLFDQLVTFGRQLDAHLAIHEATDMFRQRQQVVGRHWADRFDRYLLILLGLGLSIVGQFVMHEVGLK